MAQAEPVILRIVGSKFRVPLRPGDPREAAKDAEDVASQARLKLVNRLRSDQGSDEIRDIEGYAALAAHTAHVDFLREKRRHWFGLREKLRYLLEEAKEFAIWKNREFQDIGGLADWREKEEAPREKVDHLRENPALLLSGMSGSFKSSLAKPPAFRMLIEALLKRVEGGVSLDDLVAIVAPLVGATDFRGDPESDERYSGQEQFASERSPEDIAISSEAWHTLWREICALQQRARTVYLLHFSPGEFEGFQIYGIVTSPKDIGRALELSHEQYERLWPELRLKAEDLPALELVRGQTIRGEIKFLLVWKYLPLADLAIAVVLQSTPNAVRKLRSVTRDLLRSKCNILYGLNQIKEIPTKT